MLISSSLASQPRPLYVICSAIRLLHFEMAARHQLHALRNHPNLQRFLIAVARPTGRELGVGSYGSVEELEVGGVVCAGKKIHESLIEKGNIGTDSIASRYVEECQLMSDLRHPHLVQFLGVCFLPSSSLPVLVMERLLTNLDDLLEHSPDIPLSLKRSILADVARGLVYLHSHSPPVIHRDLSARNVLLNSAMVAKITDLGNARIVNFKPGQLARTLSRIPGTMVYMPPEAFEATSKYGPSLDSFSFGHLSLFTITQVFPGTLLQYTYRDPADPSHRLARTEVQRRDEYIKLLHKQLGEQHPLVLLVKQCLDDEPSERPSAQELLQQLEGMKTHIKDPYQHLTKLDAMRMLKEKDTQVEASGASSPQLVAMQTKMEQLQADLESRETRILELVDETERKEEVIHRLMAQLRGLQSQLQMAPVTPDLPSKPDEKLTGNALASTTSTAATSVSHTGPGGDRLIKKKPHKYEEVDDLPSKREAVKVRRTRSASASMTSAAASGSSASLTGPGGDRPAKKKPHEYEEVDPVLESLVEETEAEIHTELPPVRQDLPSKREAVKVRRTRSASASMTSAAASGSSASLTGPGGDRPAKKKPHEYEEVDPVLEALVEETEADIHTELPPVRQDLPSKPDEKLTGDASSSTTSTAATSVSHTGPGGDRLVVEVYKEAYPIPSPRTKKKTTAMEHPRQAEGRSEGLTPVTEVVGIYAFTGSAAHDLPSKPDEKLTGDASSSTTSTAATSASHTGPGGDGLVVEVYKEAYPIPSPRTKKKTTAMEHPRQAEGRSEGLTPGTEVVGIDAFTGSAAHDLPFKCGDVLTIISRDSKNWYKARRYDGLEGMIPSTHVKETLTGDTSSPTASATVSSAKPRQAVQLQIMPWFHGDISRERAEQLLKPFENGTFLVQEAKNYKEDYTLCVSLGNKVEHYRVRRNVKSWVTVDEEQYFENLVKLVEHYQRDAHGLCCRLKYPVEKTSGNIEYTVSVQDFEERGWAIPRKSLNKRHLIGKGKFKDVWLGEYQGQKVAIIMAKDHRDSQQLLAEAGVMTALQHPNLVSLIGVCLDEPPVYLITEYMAKGSLLGHLRCRGRAHISQQDQLDFARDVCKGMVYLEAQNLVHRNLAARNVLIGDDNTAKVSGFRLTREELFMTEQVLTLMVQWTAPEALKERKFSSKSDVWSFGILLWEIYSYGKPPYPQVPNKEVPEHVAAGNRMSAPEGCPAGAYQIMKECWDKDASLRLNFTQIGSMLERLSTAV